MYFNVFGEKVSRAKYKQMLTATGNRRELVAAGLGRRDLFKMGLLTASGHLIAKNGLSARSASVIPQAQLGSPPTKAFVTPLPIMPVKQPVASLTPAPQVNPLPNEGRTRPHQALQKFPPKKLYQVQQTVAAVRVSPDLPEQIMWGFDGMTPGPTYANRYGEAAVVRNINSLPSRNGGFGIPSVTTHLHNGHTPSESDGFPCDFFERGSFYDQHYPNVLAGILSTHPGKGDIREALSTLWYHDHRVDFTSHNTYKGLVGFYLLFNEFDTGDETTGFHLPSFPEFDIPMVLADKVFDQDGSLFFDLFNLDGILGDRYLVNGAIQPFLQVHPRRYRFRWLNTGPSRFHELFLTDLDNPDSINPFWAIANDGNLLPNPFLVESVKIGVAERMDVIIDFSQYAGSSIYLENRMEQFDGRGPTGKTLPAGIRKNLLLRFDVVLPQVADKSADPATLTMYELPDTDTEPSVTRTFKLDRLNGQWSVNGSFMDCDTTRFKVRQDSAEVWLLTNFSGSWQHPIHIHLEEHQILSRDRQLSPSPIETCRKDVVRLQPNERCELFFRFRDFHGFYPMHCHNVVHEDHAMMLRWEVEPGGGDTNGTP